MNAGGAVALAAAIDYLESVGLENVHAQEQALTRYTYEGMKKIPGVNILGSDDPDKHCGILSFTVDGVHPHDIATILDSCHVLYEYAVFIAKIKRYRDSMELKEAIDLAVRKCIEEDILRDFLEQHRREVCDMCLTEFDEKKYEDVLREEGREEGLAEGRKKEVFMSVQEGDYGVVRGAQKLNLSVEEFEKEMSAAGYQIPVEA